MEKKKETKEMYYKMAVKLLDLMLKSGFLLPEEYEKIDALNRETFSPELAEVYNCSPYVFHLRGFSCSRMRSN